MHAHGSGRLGSDRSGFLEAVRLHALLSRAPAWAATAFPWIPSILSWKAREYDFSTRFIELAGEINTAMPYHVVDSVAEALNQHKKSLEGSKVLVLRQPPPRGEAARCDPLEKGSRHRRNHRGP